MNKIDKRIVEDIFALTFTQEGLLFHFLKDPYGSYYTCQLRLGVSGKIDFEIFEKAWGVVVNTNEMLRTFFRWEEIEHPVQVTLKKSSIRVKFIDCSNLGNDSNSRQLIEKIAGNESKEPFNLRHTPFRVVLCRLDENRHEIIIGNHHILYDGWSMGILLGEFFSAYHSLSRRSTLVVQPKTKFKEFVKQIGRKDKAAQEHFWSNYLKNYDHPAGFSIKKRNVEPPTTQEVVHLAFGDHFNSRMETFARIRKITLSTLFYSAWGLLMQKYQNRGDVVFGAVVSGRTSALKGIEDIVGLFINTIPLRIRILPGQKAESLLRDVDETLKVWREHEHTPLTDIKKYSKLETAGDLFDIIVVIENYPLESRIAPGDGALSIVSYSMTENAHYDLSVVITLFPRLEVNFRYNPGAYDKEQIERISSHFYTVVNAIISYPGQAISELDVLPEEEKERLLYRFNDTAVCFPSNRTILKLFEEAAAIMPDRNAIVGFTSGSHACKNINILTYRVLDEISSFLGGRLIEKGAAHGSIIAIRVQRSIEMVIGVLAILKTGCAYLPIQSDTPSGRVDFMLKDSRATLFLDNPRDEIEPLLRPDSPGMSGVPSFPQTSPSDPAYIIYTSGSTGTPKGVLVEHSAAVNTLTAMQVNYPFGQYDVYLLKTPYIFDVSVTELFGWFSGGGKLVVLPHDGEKDPALTVDMIERFHVSHINFVPSLFNAFVDYLFQLNDISKLSGLKYIFLAGEALLPELVAKALERAPDLPMENLYGPTEAAVYASAFPLREWSPGEDVLIGKPFPNVSLYILDRYNLPQPIGVGGELAIGGAGLAAGYLNNPALTSEKFIVSSFTEGSQRIYRTGDLACWRPCGNIQFLGRIDHQVKIRGYRIELGEIENRMLEHVDVKEAVVLALPDKNRDLFLCGYAVPRSPGQLDGESVKEHLLKTLPGYMVPVSFVLLDSMPLTPSGKIDKLGLPTPGVVSSMEYIAPRDETEKELATLWSRVLDIESGKIGIDDNFFQLGGHSLKLTGLTGKIYKSFHIKIPFSQVFKIPTIRGLAQYIRGKDRNAYTGVFPAEEKEYYPLSSAQKRLYVLQQMDTDSIVYNMNGVLELEGTVEPSVFENVFRQLIVRHESLRTSFFIVGSKPVQAIHPAVGFAVPYENLQDRPGTAGEVVRDFIRPFDLSRAPLLRAGLVKLEYQRHLLMLDIHHIATDGISMNLFVKEFMAVYAGKILPALSIRFRDYVLWCNTGEYKNLLKSQEQYWLSRFHNEPPVLSLPTDFTRPGFRPSEGSLYRFQLPLQHVSRLKALALKEEATLYMVLLSAFNILLARLTNLEDIVVGTPVSGRGQVETENICGMFVNTLVLRNAPRRWESFSRFLRQVKENTLAAFENPDYPFEELVDRAAVIRDPSRNPLFDVMFVMQNIEPLNIRIPGLTLQAFQYEHRVSRFDLTLTVTETPGGLTAEFEYCTQLFKPETIERWGTFFERIVASVVNDSQKTLAHIEIISPAEKRQILSDFNDTASAYPKDKTVVDLFKKQVLKTPDLIALMGDEQRPGPNRGHFAYITYRQFSRDSAAFARQLRSKGAGAGTIIAVMCERSIEMMIGIFAIHQVGGVYLPIDPGYPPERIEFILKDSNALFVIGKEMPADIVPPGVHILSPPVRETALPASVVPLTAPPRPGAPGYIIYTSGSTGRPKGVIIEHRSLVNRLNWMQRFYPIGQSDIILQKTPIVFDVSIWELFWWSFRGAALSLLSPGGQKDPGAIIEAIVKNKVTTIHFVPSMLNAFLQYLKTTGNENPIPLPTLHRVFSSGEALAGTQVEQFNTLVYRINRTELVNLYGPTEATVDVSYYNCPTDPEFKEKSVPIGKPIDNTRLYILDPDGGIQPVGVAGELCIAGDGLARGYLNRPGLTNEKFVPLLGTPGELLYKTGDLARWLTDGNIEFLGRIDHQVKIRGFRIELGEIESKLSNCRGVKDVAVIAKEDSTGDRYLAAFLTLTGDTRIPEVKDELSSFLPDYMIPSYFIPLDNMPLTTSGKVDRRVLAAIEIRTEKQDRTTPRDRIEEQLADAWSEILGIEKKSIGIDSMFFRLGGHSIKAGILAAKLHKEFNVKIPLAKIFELSTIRRLAEFIKKTARSEYHSIGIAPLQDDYDLSSAQKRLFVLQQVERDIGTAYNLPGAMFIDGPIDDNRLENVFRTLIRRHESLRTSFQLHAGVPRQIIHEHVDFSVSRCRLDIPGPEPGTVSRVIDAPEVKQAAAGFIITPFDLSRAPLFRVQLTRLDENSNVLLFDMHHIISDGVSMAILVKEFLALYHREQLPPLRFQYKDFSCWQNKMFRDDRFKDQREYWLSRFRGDIPVLNLQTDFPRPMVRSFKGDKTHRDIHLELSLKMKQVTNETGNTRFMILLSVFYILLSRYTGQEDIVVGVPATGRNHNDLQHIIGMFVNTLAIRNFPCRETSFGELLRDVRENMLNAYQNQDYPFDELVNRLNIPKALQRNPLFDILFVSEDTGVPPVKIGDTTFTPIEPGNKISHLDLVLYVKLKDNDEIRLELEFSTALFKKSTADKMLEHYLEILTQVLENREMKLNDIQISHNLLIPDTGILAEAQVDFGF